MAMDISRICRTCLCLDNPLLSLYEKKGKSSVADMLMDITKLKLDIKDNMPSKICLACLSEINRNYTFKLKCENSDATLRNLLFQNENEDSKRALYEAEKSKKPDVKENKPTIKQNASSSIKNEETTLQSDGEDELEGDFTEDGSEEAEAIEKELSYIVNSSDGNGEQISVGNANDSDDEFDDSDNDGGDNGTKEYYVVDENVDGQYNDNEVNVYPVVGGKRRKTSNDQDVYYINITEKSNQNQTQQKLRKQRVESPDNPSSTKKTRKMIKCKFCSMDFVFPRNLDKHISKFHAGGANSNKTTDTKDNDSGELNLVIDEAKESFSNVKNRKITIIASTTTTENISESVPEFKLSCNKCGAGFVAEKSLKYHTKYNKCTAKQYACPQCDKFFINAEKLAIHKLTHKIHSCDKCSEVFTNQNSLQKHVSETHKNLLKNQCPECDKVFSMSSTLKDHMRVHSGEKPFLCPTCGKGFTQNTNLRQHMMRHQQIKPFQCTFCTDTFVSKGELNSHMRKHTGDHPFVCEYCNKRFTTSSALVKHKRIHTGERPYSCDLCPMRFSALNTLKNHRRTHTGEKPFQCPHCPQAFAQKSDCGIHIRTHTGERPYVCQQCGSSFQQSGTLLLHLRRHAADKKLKDESENLITCLEFNEEGEIEHEDEEN